MSKTHFGYTDVTPEEKTEKVRAVFESVASRYDCMNDLMSGGLHRLWKRSALHLARLAPGHKILDLAGGTGDLSLRMAQSVPDVEIILSDINQEMLRHGRDRAFDAGFVRQIRTVLADAESLPFPDASFDRVIIGFGLRNVTRPQVALNEMRRVLKPGGLAIILEFSQPTHPLVKACYDKYSFNVIPQLGAWVTGDRAAYQYLVESIRKHPDQETLLSWLKTAGFAHADYHNLLNGVVAVHRGFVL
ncbi:MAG: bifunctional demethylmenaquinone methyltransferase/2-methoxy-6-polyprenyl-1,4-benzoquinol methylase UbiE [Pseudomonadota bacterium]